MGNYTPQKEAAIAELVAGFYGRPYEFVMAIFPWGEPTLPDGSPNPLAEKTGPEKWQAELLIALGEHIRENIERKSIGLDYLVGRFACTSGHGVGKSALVAWIIYFLMSTRADTRGVVTANTANQLETKTWPELAKWHNLALNKHWFRWSATKFDFAPYPEDKRKNYVVDALTVSEENTEAFAGLHNEGKTVFGIFDEASGIPHAIWEVMDGALTDGEAFHFAFGNPTRPDGDFADIYDPEQAVYSLWQRWQVDSREVSHTNKQALQDIITKYGEDSDEARIRVYGQFPRQAFDSYIGRHITTAAIERELHIDRGAALIMAVDVAHKGRDYSVIGWRQGRDARSRPQKTYTRVDTVRLEEIIVAEAMKEKPDAICIEAVGPGIGVIDRLRARNFRVLAVYPGAAATRFEVFANKRAELWSEMRDWLWEEGCIDDDPDLVRELTSVNYGLDKRTEKMIMESKESIKERGLPSPDHADTLMLTFAAKVARRDMTVVRGGASRRQAKTEYDPITY